MEVYHMMAVFFPIVLLQTAFLFILIRAFSAGSLAMQLEKAIGPLVYLGVLGGAVAYVLGLLSWPYSALTSSPLGRNHMLLASWTLAYWLVLSVAIWRLGSALWASSARWTMLGLSALGVVFVMITGTLGGSLAGEPSGVSDLVRLAGWEVYTTFYVPNWVLIAYIAGAVILVALGILGGRGSGNRSAKTG